MIPWTEAHQASLSFTISPSLLRLMSFESVMPSNHLILCRPLFLFSSCLQSFPASGSFGASIYRWGDQGQGTSGDLVKVPRKGQHHVLRPHLSDPRACRVPVFLHCLVAPSHSTLTRWNQDAHCAWKLLTVAEKTALQCSVFSASLKIPLGAWC